MKKFMTQKEWLAMTVRVVKLTQNTYGYVVEYNDPRTDKKIIKSYSLKKLQKALDEVRKFHIDNMADPILFVPSVVGGLGRAMIKYAIAEEIRKDD